MADTGDFDPRMHDLRIGRVLYAISLLVFLGTLVYAALKWSILVRRGGGGDFGGLGDAFAVVLLAAAGVLLSLASSFMAVVHGYRRAKSLLMVEFFVALSCYCAAAYYL